MNRFVWLILTLALTLAACHAADKPENQQSSTQADPATSYSGNVSIQVQESYIIFPTFKELVAAADVIILGQPTGSKGVVNTARNINDISQPDAGIFSIGQVYQVQVERYLKGDGPQSISVIQNQGIFTLESLGLTADEVTASDIEQVRQLFAVLPLTIGRQYIFFLSAADFAYGELPKEGTFGLSGGLPWRFHVASPDCVYTEDTEAEIARYYPPQTLDDFLGLIQDPGSISGVPYPAPGILQECPPKVLRPYP